MISTKTRICGLIGNPVEHSVSPEMHNAAFEKLGLNFIYLPFRVTPENLEKAILGMRGLGMVGFNVTMPHKASIMKFLDEIDKTAEKIGAVNTIVNKDGKLLGFNTDGPGALWAFQEAGVNFKNKKVVMLGAGGAAKAIAFYLMSLIKKLVIAGKTREEAQSLAKDLKKYFKKEIKGIENNTDNLRQELKNAQILINATPIGMAPDINSMPIKTELLRSNLTVFDSIYNPIETKLLREARKIGAKTINGVNMLVYQGAEAFKLWTGKNAPVELMKKIVIKRLKNVN